MRWIGDVLYIKRPLRALLSHSLYFLLSLSLFLYFVFICFSPSDPIVTMLFTTSIQFSWLAANQQESVHCALCLGTSHHMQSLLLSSLSVWSALTPASSSTPRRTLSHCAFHHMESMFFPSTLPACCCPQATAIGYYWCCRLLFSLPRSAAVQTFSPL